MKSKIYSSRYMKVSSKGMVWIPAFVTIGFLLAFPVAELILLGNWFGYGYTTEQISRLYEQMWCEQFMFTGLAVGALAALFNGISQFWYLYSPRKIDFYHSLPVKRSGMFWYKTLQSLLYYLVPYLVMEFFSVCIGAMRGFFSLHLMKLAFLMMVLHLLLYLLLYFSVVLVICLTGHILMGALLLGAVAFYGPVLSLLLQLYENTFYYTYTVGTDTITQMIGEAGAPQMLAYSFIEKYADGNYSGTLIGILLLTVVLGASGYYTYVHRKSERTGQAFVYKWAGIVVRFLVVVPTGLGVGIVFYMLPTDSSRTAWWIFGMILGTILCNGIMGIIYHMDFRKFFANKIQFVVSGAAVAVCAAVFCFDLTGYDTYIPSYDKIENISAGFSVTGVNYSYNVQQNEDGTVLVKDTYIGNVSDCNAIGIDPDIYSLIETIEERSYESCKKASDKEDGKTLWKVLLLDEDGVQLPIRYELKSGKYICRTYSVSRENLKELLQASYGQGTLKTQQYSILQLDAKYVGEVACTFVDGQNIFLFQDNQAKKEQLVEAFRQDVEEASAEELVGEPCAALSINYANIPTAETLENMMPGDEKSTCELYGYFYVFPQFKRTIEILKETGYPVSMEDVDLKSVEVQYYMNEEKTEISSPVVYTDADQLEELKKVLRNYSLLPGWEKPGSDAWEYIDVTISGQESNENWGILDRDVPEFIKEDAQRALAFEVYEE